jgi:hypothetical protein
MALTKVQSALTNLGVVNVLDYGAVGDGVTDDAAAIQAAIDSIDDGTGGIINVPPGTYQLGATLTIALGDITLAGSGRGNTILRASHSAGPVVRIKKSYSHVHDMSILATSGRTAGAAGSNFGIQFECDDLADSTDLRIWHCSLKNLYVYAQPNHNIVTIGAAYMHLYENVESNSSGGHGFAIGLGANETGRANVPPPPGVMTLTNCGGFRNAGHCLAAGHPSDTVITPSLRVMLLNFDCAYNAQDAGVRHEQAEVYLRGSNHSATGCAMNGAQEGFTTPVRVGFFAVGNSHQYDNNRYIYNTSCVEVANEAGGLITEGIEVRGLRIIGTRPDPEVLVGTGVVGVSVSGHRPMSATNPPVSRNKGGITVGNIPQIIPKQADQTVTSSTTLVDDAYLKFYLEADENVYFRLFLIHKGNGTADIKVAVAVPSGAGTRYGPVGGIKVDAADAVVVQDMAVSGGTAIVFGASASRRVISLEGYVFNGSTAGEMKVQWAQNVSDGVSTIVEGGTGRSSLMVWRHGQ